MKPSDISPEEWEKLLKENNDHMRSIVDQMMAQIEAARFRAAAQAGGTGALADFAESIRDVGLDSPKRFPLFMVEGLETLAGTYSPPTADPPAHRYNPERPISDYWLNPRDSTLIRAIKAQKYKLSCDILDTGDRIDNNTFQSAGASIGKIAKFYALSRCPFQDGDMVIHPRLVGAFGTIQDIKVIGPLYEDDPPTGYRLGILLAYYASEAEFRRQSVLLSLHAAPLDHYWLSTPVFYRPNRGQDVR